MLQTKSIRKKTISKRATSKLKRPSQLLYATVRDRILVDLKKTDLKPGDRYFTEGELALRYDVSRNTIRRAMAELEERGYLTRHRGLGNFIPQTSPSSALPISSPAIGTSFKQSPQNTSRPLVVVLPEWDDSTDGFYSGRVLRELTALTGDMNLVIQIRHHNDLDAMGNPENLPIVAIF
ncbi:GntR family transcriptional regulator [bacterium AH-315-I18]|nr:GntR family transcriptional regulator [bacterium AH-315-I18]